MKSLQVLVLCCLCCVNAYRIFPLPGQNVASTSKLGSFDQSTLRSTDQTTKAPEVDSRLPIFTPSSSFSLKSGSQPQTSIIQVRTTFENFVKPSSTAQSVSPTFKSKAVAISATNQESRLEGSNQKAVTTIPAVKNTFGNVARPLSIAHTAVPPTFQTLTAAKILNSPSSNNQALFQKPQHFAVEPLAKDLLPPKEDSKPGLPTKVIINSVPPRPTVEAPFNDLLPPKTS